MSNTRRDDCVWDLYVIMDAEMAGRSHADVAKAALAGGARVLQLRDKNTDFESLLEIGAQLRELTREAGAMLIVNDNPYLAKEIDADGVHLGQTDIPADIAQEIVGPDKIIGLSTHSRQQALAAQLMPVNYIGVGPIFETSTKQSEWPVVGLPLIRWVRNTISLPMVAIGGITEATLPDVVAAGAHNVAMIGEIMRARDIEQHTRELLAQIREWKSAG